MKKGIIIGAGIGGLTTAIALQRRGFEVTVYEKAAGLREAGAGLTLAPNGLRVLQELGLAEEVYRSGQVLESALVTDIHMRPFSAIDGRWLSTTYGHPLMAMHRARLQQILASHLGKDNILLNKSIRSYGQNNNSVIAYFEDGTHYEGDFMIAADGLRSKIRARLHPGLQLRYAGQTSWRFITRYALPNTGTAYEIWGNQKGLRVGYVQVHPDEVYCFITNCQPPGIKSNRQTLRQDLLKLCAAFPPLVHELIQSCDEDAILQTDLFDFQPIKNWADGRVALLGDAAHATTPNLGQGASQALEDAHAIAHALSTNATIPQALDAYQKKRIQKAAYITRRSRQMGQVTNTSGVIKKLIMQVLSAIPASWSNKQLNKIYRAGS
ncbi:FAD-dependent oxidoreductase [Niabella sp.]|uniref:FAD-dependent oxidoreductase n=1 Tax=Niabella sp. TaxID=1962976 RepID=UPI002636B8C0|nr:FAD-dependent oxidoreductase [Niabella sp.]